MCLIGFIFNIKSDSDNIHEILNKKGNLMKILLSAILALFLVACSEEKPKEAQEVKTEEPKSAKVTVTEVAKEAEKIVVEAKEETKKVVTQVVKEAEVAAVKAVSEVKKEVAKVAEITNSAVQTTVAKVNEAVATAPVDGMVIYKTCTGCHGAKAEKPALGKSKIIKGWSVEKIEDALNGYADGSYGGAMKGIMKSQAAKLTTQEIKAVSEYISKL